MASYAGILVRGVIGAARIWTAMVALCWINMGGVHGCIRVKDDSHSSYGCRAEDSAGTGETEQPLSMGWIALLAGGPHWRPWLAGRDGVEDFWDARATGATAR